MTKTGKVIQQVGAIDGGAEDDEESEEYYDSQEEEKKGDHIQPINIIKQRVSDTLL